MVGEILHHDQMGWVLKAEPFTSDGLHLMPASFCLFRVALCKGFEPYLEPLFKFPPRDIKSKHLSPQVAQSLSSEWGMCKKNRERPFNYRDHSWLRNSTGETWKTGSRRHTTESFTLFIANLLLRRTRLLVYSPTKACLIVMGPVILPSLSWISLPCTSPSHPGDLA